MTSNDQFATTRWTLVLAAGNRQEPQAERALEELCRIYWYPLYGYVRRHGYSKEAAEDLTQAFFAEWIESHAFAKADENKGKFRSFMLASLKRFVANEHRDDHAQKRRPAAGLVSLDEMMDEVGLMYQREVEYELKTLGAQIEPILIVCLGAMVLVLALGIFLPMWDLGKVAMKR